MLLTERQKSIWAFIFSGSAPSPPAAQEAAEDEFHLRLSHRPRPRLRETETSLPFLFYRFRFDAAHGGERIGRRRGRLRSDALMRARRRRGSVITSLLSGTPVWRIPRA